MSTKLSQGTVVAGSLISKVHVLVNCSVFLMIYIHIHTYSYTQGANKLRERIEPNEKPTEVPESVQKGVHYTRKATGCVVGVSEFLMMSLAKLTVKVGMGVADTIKDSEVNICLQYIHRNYSILFNCTCMPTKGRVVITSY